MGKWNRRRWYPRQRYNYEYQEPPPSPPDDDPPQGVDWDGVPSWEIAFCRSMRVRWRKVVNAKKYMYSHEHIFKWDDSSGEEAFHSAKRRYWATINGLPCEDPLADPDAYIDEIDWNPSIDPQLLLDTERAYFCPDDAEISYKMEIKTQATAQHDKIADDGYDPWVRKIQDTDKPKDVTRGWQRRNNSVDLKDDDNPWEQGHAQAGKSKKDLTWKSCDELWGQNNKWQPTEHDGWHENSWRYDSRNGWGNNKKSYWHQNKCNNSSDFETKNSFNYGDPSRSNVTPMRGPPRGRGQWGNQNSELPSWERRGSGGGRQATYVGCRKREGSFQHSSRYKSSRFHGNEYHTAYGWQ